MNETIETILKRRSVRKFASKTIDKETLTLLVQAAMAAPSGVNKQPWEVIIVDERQVLEELGVALPYAKMCSTAAAAFVICGNLERACEGLDQELWIQDCSAATQNLLVAATSLGIGTVWTAVHPHEDWIATVRRILDLPSHIVPLNVVPTGYPVSDGKPMDKFKEEQLHWQKW